MSNIKIRKLYHASAQYEMAYKMQIAAPEVMNINDEPQYIHDMYGTKPGEV